MGGSEMAHAVRAKDEAEAAKAEAEKGRAEAEARLAEALAGKAAADRELGKCRAAEKAAEERAQRLAEEAEGLRSEREAARQELLRARLGQGAAFTAFFERAVCSALFPTVASDIAGSLSLVAIDGVLDDVAKDFPSLEKAKYADPPLDEEEVTRSLASVAAGWMRESPVLRAVKVSPTLLTEEEIRQLCPEDRDLDFERFVAEVRHSAIVPPEGREEDEGRAEMRNSEAPRHLEVPHTNEIGAEETPSLGSAPEQNVE